MVYAVKVNNQKSTRKKYLFHLYLTLGCNIGACISYVFYKDFTLVFLISSILSILQLMRDKICEPA
jgi:hypothetical protein